MALVKAKIDSNRPALFQICGRMACCIKKKRISQLEQANEKISRELDFVRFLQQQMLTHITRKILFTKTERLFMRNQRDPFVLARNHSHSDDSEFFDSDEFDMVEEETQQFKTLMQRVIGKKNNFYSPRRKKHA